MAKLNWSTDHSQITDEIINRSASTAAGIAHDMFYNSTSKPVVISTGAGGTGTVLTEDTDYTIAGDVTDYPANVTDPTPDVAYTTIAIINATYLSTVLYTSYYPLGDLAEGSDVFSAGMIMPFGGDSAPTGWLSCDGSAVSRGTYAGLYAAIGTTWGTGDDSTTFNVPDLRGVFLRGAGENGTLDDSAGNAFNGGSVGDTANDQMQQITGSFGIGRLATASSLFDNTEDGAFTRTASSGDSKDTAEVSASTQDADVLNFDSADSPDARTGDETQPVNATVLYIIKC